MTKIRICRIDETHTHDHYWDKETGKMVEASTFTGMHQFYPEELCGRHNKKNKKNVQRTGKEK